MRNKILGTINTKIVNSILIFLFCFYYNTHNVNGFYVPGVAPQDYKKDDVVDVKVIRSSSNRQMLAFLFYFIQLFF